MLQSVLNLRLLATMRLFKHFQRTLAQCVCTTVAKSLVVQRVTSANSAFHVSNSVKWLLPV